MWVRDHVYMHMINCQSLSYFNLNLNKTAGILILFGM